MKNVTVNLELPNERSSFSLGEHIAQLAHVGTVFYLHGELGVGKTTFARGFLQGRGYFGKVKSPTYTIVESYLCNEGSVFHLDLYRLQNPEELEFMGVRDYLSENGILLVEWPDLGKGFLPEPTLDISMDFLEEGRKASLMSSNLAGQDLLNKFEPRSPYRKVNFG